MDHTRRLSPNRFGMLDPQVLPTIARMSVTPFDNGDIEPKSAPARSPRGRAALCLPCAALALNSSVEGSLFEPGEFAP